MKRQLLLALLAAGLAAAPGCADKRDAVPGIRITPSIKTRVTGLHFDTGDCIGLTVTKNGSDYVRNHQMTYDGSAFTASGLLWYNDLNETSTLTAYFPYSASGVPDEFSVARDQSAGCASSDLLGAVAKNVTPTGTPVGMLFYHLMSQLTIVITNNSDAAVSGGATVRSGTPLRGICPEGWHVPALAELEALLAAGPAAGFFRCAGYWIVNGTSNRYGDADKGYLISCEATAERSGCLVYSTTTDPVTGEVPLGYGLSVRCVKDDAVR